MSAVLSLPTEQILRRPHNIVTVDGLLLDAITAEAHHGVNRPIGTATVACIPPGYTETELRDRWINKPIEIQVGYEETGGARRIFSGRVARISREWGERGTRLQVRCNGWASILDFPSETDQEFGANALLYDVIRALCELRGVPLYGGEPITLADGVTPVRLGNVPEIDEGKVIIPKRSSWLQWIDRACRLFGYRAFDRPDGFFWWQRVSGVPAAAPVMAFAQADNVISIGRDDDVSGIVTWNDVLGARYEDADGIQVQVRSFPGVVPPFPFDPPPDFVREEIRSQVLVNQTLADAARAAAEADRSGPYEMDRWAFLGENTVQPGDVVALTSTALELDDARRWVMTTDHSSGRGYKTDWTGWAGFGMPIPGGDDTAEVPVVTGPVHVGDEYLWHYAVPSPTGKEVTFNVTIPDTYTAAWVEGWAHGVNSYLLGGVNTESEVSKIEAWQGDDERPKGTGVLPVMPENLAQRYPYSQLPTHANPRHWIRFRIPIPGRYDPGVVKIILKAGEDKRIGASFRWDDFEVYQVMLKLSGVGYPELPGGAP